MANGSMHSLCTVTPHRHHRVITHRWFHSAAGERLALWIQWDTHWSALVVIKHREREREWRSIRDRTNRSHSNEVCVVIVFTIYALLLVVRWSGRSVHRQIIHTLDFASNLLCARCIEPRFCWQPRLLLPYSIVCCGRSSSYHHQHHSNYQVVVYRRVSLVDSTE